MQPLDLGVALGHLPVEPFEAPGLAGRVAVQPVDGLSRVGELRREALDKEIAALKHPDVDSGSPYVTQALSAARGPVVAATDWMRAVPDQIRQWVPGDYITLGTDGFGFSDTRTAARRVFNVDAQSIVVAVLTELAREGHVDRSVLKQAIDRYQLLDVAAADPGAAWGDA